MGFPELLSKMPHLEPKLKICFYKQVKFKKTISLPYNAFATYMMAKNTVNNLKANEIGSARVGSL